MSLNSPYEIITLKYSTEQPTQKWTEWKNTLGSIKNNIHSFGQEGEVIFNASLDCGIWHFFCSFSYSRAYFSHIEVFFMCPLELNAVIATIASSGLQTRAVVQIGCIICCKKIISPSRQKEWRNIPILNGLLGCPITQE